MQYRLLRVLMGVLVLVVVVLPPLVESHDQTNPTPLEAFLRTQKMRGVRVEMWRTGQEVFAVPVAGCRGPIQVLEVSSLLDDQAIVDRRFPPTSVRTFVYLDKTWSRLDHLEVWTTYSGALARNVVRTDPLINLETIVEIVSPTRCDGIRSIDWRTLWNASPRQ